MKLKYYLLLLLTLYTTLNYCQPHRFTHPRGIIHKDEIAEIQKRLTTEPYGSMLQSIHQTKGELEQLVQSGNATIYDSIFLVSNLAYLYTLTGEIPYASQGMAVAKEIIHTSEYLNNSISRGLTRATVVFNLAVFYDLCYGSLEENERQLLLDAMFKGMQSVNSNMGYSANYALESNWMGIRYATTLFTALVWDETDTTRKRSRVLPFIWDTQKRLADHIDLNIHPQGWNAESLGYHNYNWSFIAPAIMALQNNFSHKAFFLKNYAPDALGSLHAMAATYVPLLTRENQIGVKPDYSDDNINGGMFLFACGQQLYPEYQQPAIKWMYNYFVSAGIPEDERGVNFFNIACDQSDVEPINPETLKWQHFVDTVQGVVVFRDRFKDKEDIVFAYNTTAIRVKGHQGFDNQGIRLIGLGNVWIVGAGRTGEIAGQSTLFAGGNINKMKGEQGAVGNLLDYEFTPTGGSAKGSGSSMHVENHIREVSVNYQPSTGASAVIKIRDTSGNGKTWRINTPEFNKVNVTKNGFELHAPNGSYIEAVVISGPENVQVSVSDVRYGGSTTRHNPGICFKDECYEYTKAIDIACNGNIEIELRLFDGEE